MQFAKNEKGERTYILEAVEDGRYYCPFCEAPMIQRRGLINIPHFAHAKGCLCTDNWKYEDMSEWHVSWQERYPLANREVAVINELGRHRADILINDTVIEFQHSPMSAEEFQERNNFYTACGYKVIWLFDSRSDYNASLIKDDSEMDVYRWKHAPKTLSGFDLSGNVQVYFHLQDTSQEEGGIVIRLTWCCEGDLGYFKSASATCYSEAEFIELTETGAVKKAIDVSGKNELYHELIILRRKDNEMDEAYGCPINPDGYASDVPMDDRLGCSFCQYAREMNEYSPGVRKCACRFRELLDQVDTVLETERRDGQIYSVSYIAKDGSIKTSKVDVPESPATSIIELSRLYDAGVMCVRNIKTGYQFKITKDIDEMLEKYGRVYGYYWNEKYGSYSKQSNEIYGPWRPEWVVTWFKTKEQVREYRQRFE